MLAGDEKFRLICSMIEKIDDIDRRLLIALQRDATLSLDALAEQLSVSTNTCWRRVKRLEDAGIILRRVVDC